MIELEHILDRTLPNVALQFQFQVSEKHVLGSQGPPKENACGTPWLAQGLLRLSMLGSLSYI